MDHLDEMADRVRDVLAAQEGISEKRMFGGICFLHNNNMVCGCDNSPGLMLRVGPDAYEETLQLEHAGEMDFTGRPMKGFVHVEPEGYESQEELAEWISRAIAFTSTLPPKVPKPKAKRKRKTKKK